MIDNIITFFIECLSALIQSYWGGILFLLYGVWTIKRQLKPKDKKYSSDDILIMKMRGWASGIGALILAGIVIVSKLLGKF